MRQIGRDPTAVSGAAPTPVRAWQQVTALSGLAKVVTGYGMPELAGSTVLSQPGEMLKLVETTVGHIMNGGVASIPELGGGAEYGTADPLTRAAAGGHGRRVRLSKPDANARTLRFARADIGGVFSWQLVAVGRSGVPLARRVYGADGPAQGAIKSGGELVSPEVEELVSHPAVTQAFVCGLPDERWGEDTEVRTMLSWSATCAAIGSDHSDREVVGKEWPWN